MAIVIVTVAWGFGEPISGVSASGATCDSLVTCQALTPPSCTGVDACSGSFAATVEAGSCIGDFACHDATGSIGTGSCNGVNACVFQNLGTVGDNACNGDGGACFANLGVVGDNSCNGGTAGGLGYGAEASCWSNQIVIGAGSCNGGSACLTNLRRIGDGSCNGTFACFQNLGLIGNNACNGDDQPPILDPNDGTCANTTTPLGDPGIGECQNNFVVVPACVSPAQALTQAIVDALGSGPEAKAFLRQADSISSANGPTAKAGKIRAFINHVNAQTGKVLTPTEAAELIALANLL